MPGTPFSIAAREAARATRRLPAALRRALAHRVRDDIATPLAASIAQSWVGPYAAVLASATKARVSADPRIAVGGSRPRLSGGAGPRDLVFGVEWGGGKRRTRIARTSKHAGYVRHSTRQFPTAQHTAYGTVGEQLPHILDTYAGIVLAVVDEEVGHG